MRVWIISDKRYGESDESHWIAECSHDPEPGADPEESIWDRVENRGRRCKSEAEARRVAARLKSNVVNAATIYKRELRQVERDVFDWEIVGDTQEVECIYDPAAG
jgi:hypothetical protein